jgi:hypothetical protein
MILLSLVVGRFWIYSSVSSALYQLQGLLVVKRNVRTVIIVSRTSDSHMESGVQMVEDVIGLLGIF